jgi:hypothetical protein
MKKPALLWGAFFLTTYGIIVGIVVKVATLPIEVKVLIIVGHAVAYMTVIYAEVAKFREHFGSAEQWLRTLSNVGKAGRKREIYGAMGNAIGYLSRYAYLTYFNNRGPAESKKPSEIAYHEQLHKAITTRPDTTFRRIIAVFDTDSVAKRQWVKEQVELARDSDNYTLRFIAATDPLQLPLNAQIFDDFVFLIDPSRSNEDTLARDIHFLSAEIAAIWFRYYREIWDQKCSVDVPPAYFASLPSPTPKA